MGSHLFSSGLPPEILTALLEGAFDGIAVTENRRILYANSGLACLFGYTVEEMQGRDSADFAVPGEHAERVRAAMLANEPVTYPAHGIRKDGTTIFGEIRGLPYDWNGRRLRLTAFRDQTRAVLTERRLRESEARFRTIIETAEEGVWQVDAEGHTVFVNPRMASSLGYLPEEMLGRPMLSFVPEELRPAIVQRMDERRQGRRDQYEIRYRHRDGHDVWMINSVAPILAPISGVFEGAIGFHTDITERRLAEDKLTELRSRMLASSQASALSEIANGISHEITNPLSVIRAYNDVLREAVETGELRPRPERSATGPVEDAEAARARLLAHVDHIESTVGRITQIVRTLVVFTRDTSPVPYQPVAVTTLLRDARALCETRFRQAGIELRTGELPDDACEVACRSVPMSQVLLNLLNNGADAAGAPGAPIPRWVELSARDLGDQVEIAVEDSGPGVPAEVRKRIMQPFYTTKPAGQGMGLGLAISRKIVEDHGGTLRLESDGVPTRFVVRLRKQP